MNDMDLELRGKTALVTGAIHLNGRFYRSPFTKPTFRFPPAKGDITGKRIVCQSAACFGLGQVFVVLEAGCPPETSVMPVS